MRLTVIGCAGSFPGPASPSSSYLVAEPDPVEQDRTWRILLDAGNGSLGVLQRHTDPLRLDAIFLSHLHADHCLDLTGLHVMAAYAPGRPDRPPIPVFGPVGTRQRLEVASGVRPGGLDAVFAVEELVAGTPVEVGPITVTPLPVNHPVPTFGLRVGAGGRVLAYTGDTDSCPGLTPLLAGADLALMECSFVDGRDAVRDLHLTGSRAAEAAVAAGGVGRLMLTHLPAWNDPELCRAQAGAVWPGEVELAEPEATYQI